MIWWPMAASMALAYFLAWYWLRNRQLLPPPRLEPPGHWTPIDLQAWKLVEARARAADKLDAAKFVDIHFYLDVAQAMACELAQNYHPGTADPVGPVTVPEILTVIELAAHDLAKIFEENVPGGHLVTIGHFRKAQRAIDLYQKANAVYWLIGTLFNPIETGTRLAASQLGLSTTWSKLQENLTQWFYVAFVHELGRYLIDLESGRLKVGARRYRELTEADQDSSPAAAKSTGPLTIAVFGQTKAGKSSLINALLGEQRAAVDVIPLTDEVCRYQLRLNDALTLAILDTPDMPRAAFRRNKGSDVSRFAMPIWPCWCACAQSGPAARCRSFDRLVTLVGEQPNLRSPPLLGC